MVDEKKENIFNEFAGVSKETWLKQAIKDLKSPELQEWTSDEGLLINPFYTQEDLADNTLRFLYSKSDPNWKYFETIDTVDSKEANSKALYALNNGADGLIFKMKENTPPGFRHLLKNILLQHCHIVFDIEGKEEEIIKYYFKYINKNKIPLQEIKGALFWDPLTDWTLNAPKSSPDFEKLIKMLTTSDLSPDFRYFSITSEVYKNSGATAIQEVSLMVSSLIEYLKVLNHSGIKPEVVFRKSWFNVSIGKNFYFEISKLRALKLLVLQIAKIYKVQNFNYADVNLHATTSWWTKTAEDSYTNILRNTTEAMAGILGGCSSLSILSHDIVVKDSNEFSSRISRNISNLLKEEAYMDKVSNPVDGSYYVENLTRQMLHKIWDNVQTIEEKGGFTEAFKNGFILEMLAANYNNSINSVVKLKEKVVGSNSFVNQENIDSKLHINVHPKGWFKHNRLTEVLEQDKYKS